MTTQPFFFFFYSNKVKGGKERERGEGAGNGVTDRQNHPKENRQCCSPHYGFRFWYEPEMQSGGHYIKPRSVLPGLISAVICVMARSMWMKSSGRLYYDRPSVKSRTKMRAVDRTLPRNCVGPTGWRAWFVQHAFKLENVLLSFLHPGTNVSTLAVLPYPPFFFSLPSYSFPSPSLRTQFQFPLRVDRHSHLDDLAFFLCFQVSGEVGGGWKVRGRPCAWCCLRLCQHNLCSVIPFPLDLTESGGGGWWGAAKTVISCTVVGWHTTEGAPHIIPYMLNLYRASWGLSEGSLWTVLLPFTYT